MLVRAERFSVFQVLGDPLHEVVRFSQWNVDELIYIDISPSALNVDSRADHRVKVSLHPMEILQQVSEKCFVPLTFGGRIRTIEQMAERFLNGADKITLNSAAIENPSLITNAAKRFGSQALVVSIDVKPKSNGREWEVFADCGSRATGMDVLEWVKLVEDHGAGEILLNNIERDGTGLGYDLELIAQVCTTTNLPVIACGGAGNYEHFVEAAKSGASAVAAANIWHFKEMVDRLAKRVLAQAGVPVRLDYI